jgi:hypothetical protein
MVAHVHDFYLLKGNPSPILIHTAVYISCDVSIKTRSKHGYNARGTKWRQLLWSDHRPVLDGFRQCDGRSLVMLWS